MYQRFVNLLRGLSTNWLGSLGVALTTTAFVLFVFIEILRVLGIVTSSYVGLITYLALPALFIVGLVMIPIAWRLVLRATGKTTEQLLTERFDSREIAGKAYGSRLMRMFLVLTVLNILFLGGGTARMLSFMEEPEFCGTACHSVMGPEWATYQASPHAHVKCVECHVGEGADALLDSKINGLWQMVSVTFDLYERPIPTPVRQLRPARETCEHCHWPDKFYGDKLLKKVRYAMDEPSTPEYTTLGMRIGSGLGDHRGEIHWHVAEKNAVRYQAADDQRQRILWVEVLQDDGSWIRYQNRTMARQADAHVRTMDCVDCHNRATHIYEDPENAVDQRIAKGEIDRGLPFVKREALAALTGDYADEASAMQGIENAISGFYRREYPSQMGGFLDGIDHTVASLQAAWRRNIHPAMHVTWGSYPSQLGHKAGGGCFRCHNADMIDERGTAVPYDCTLCHSILADDSVHPFQFLLPVKEKGDPDAKMHQALQDDFLKSLQP